MSASSSDASTARPGLLPAGRGAAERMNGRAKVRSPAAEMTSRTALARARLLAGDSSMEMILADQNGTVVQHTHGAAIATDRKRDS
jgi:hypothetical protein